jgi:hypothetical protein
VLLGGVRARNGCARLLFPRSPHPDAPAPAHSLRPCRGTQSPSPTSPAFVHLPSIPAQVLVWDVHNCPHTLSVHTRGPVTVRTHLLLHWLDCHFVLAPPFACGPFWGARKWGGAMGVMGPGATRVGAARERKAGAPAPQPRAAQ